MNEYVTQIGVLEARSTINLLHACYQRRDCQCTVSELQKLIVNKLLPLMYYI